MNITKIIITQDDMNGDRVSLGMDINKSGGKLLWFDTRIPYKTGVKFATDYFPDVPITVYNQGYD